MRDVTGEGERIHGQPGMAVFGGFHLGSTLDLPWRQVEVAIAFFRAEAELTRPGSSQCTTEMAEATAESLEDERLSGLRPRHWFCVASAWCPLGTSAIHAAQQNASGKMKHVGRCGLIHDGGPSAA